MATSGNVVKSSTKQATSKSYFQTHRKEIMRGFTRLQRLSRRVIDYIDSKAIILMYHRVNILPGYIFPISVTQDNFRNHMAYLRQSFNPIRLEDLAIAVKNKSIPRGAVAVTFDDGYADNYFNALPILKEFQFPATIFVSSGYIDKKNEYWWG